ASGGRSNSPNENSSQSTGSTADKSALRYDGKTFDEWHRAWQTELSTDKRMQAVKALAAFGAHGYGKEAADAILDVAGEYDFYIINSDAEGKLKETIIDQLTPEYRPQTLVKFWLPELAARVERDPKKWKDLASNLFYRVKLDDESVIKTLRSLAESGPNATR